MAFRDPSLVAEESGLDDNNFVARARYLGMVVRIPSLIYIDSALTWMQKLGTKHSHLGIEHKHPRFGQSRRELRHGYWSLELHLESMDISPKR